MDLIELNGYDDEAETPMYRSGRHFMINLHFDGPRGISDTLSIGQHEVPKSLRRGMDGLCLRQPIAELEALSRGSASPELPLSMSWIEGYRREANANRAPHILMLNLNRAGITVPATYLKGLLDRIKSTALTWP